MLKLLWIQIVVFMKKVLLNHKTTGITFIMRFLCHCCWIVWLKVPSVLADNIDYVMMFQKKKVLTSLDISSYKLEP